MEMEGKGERAEEERKVPLHRLFKFGDGLDVVFMTVGTLAAMANGMTQPLTTFLFGEMIDAFGGATNSDVLQRVDRVCLHFVGLGVVTALASFLQVACWTMTGERQATRIRAIYLKAVLRQDIAFFDKDFTTGQAVARMSADAILIQDAIGEKFGKFIQLVTTFVGGFVVAFVRGWLLALVMLSCIPPVVIVGVVLSRMLSTISSRSHASYSDAADVVEQTIGSIKTVISFNGEKQAIALYNKFIKTAYKAAVQEAIANGLGMGCFYMIFFSSCGLPMWYGGRLIIHKGYNGGEILTILFAIVTGAMALGTAAPCVLAFAEGQTAAYRMFQTINRLPVIDSADKSGVVLQGIRGEVELKDVYFSYPARPDQLVFAGFSLRVPTGITMAIVGESGSGKSTVISLVERFYDPQGGAVLIDGVNIKSLRLDWMRGEIGLVSQEPLLFMTTIKENIIYGKEDATLEEIRTAVQLANAAGFIDKLPNGLETMVGQRGAQLSGGQKQRIAIARAILKNPKILLLDEATSALDLDSERIVQDALNRIMVERTTIVVAHRLSTVRNADNIAVIHQGKIVDQGSHDELIKDPNGAYSQLIRLQETNSEAEAHYGVSSASISESMVSTVNSNKHSDDVLDHDTVEEQVPQEHSDDVVPKKAPFRRLFTLNKPELLVLLLGSIAAAVHGIIFPMFGILLATSIKTFYEPHEQLLKDSSFLGLMCVVIGVVSLIAIPMQYSLFGVAGGKLIERIRSLSFRSVVHQEVGWFDESSNSSGAIGARLSVDALNVRRLVGDTLALVVQSAVTLLTGFLVAVVSDWKLALIITVVIPLLGAEGYAQVQFMKGFNADARTMYEDASQVASDAVSGIRTVASFCAEEKVMDTYTRKCEASMKQGIRTGLVGGIGFGFSFLMLYCTYALCFYVGAQFIRHGQTTFTDVFKVFFALLLATVGVSQASTFGTDSTKAKQSATSIFSLLDRKSKIDSSSDDGVVLEHVEGEIEFQHVSFKYPLRPDVQIFSDFTLSIHSGQTVALVGESGSGKSTVISLLERFYDPESGTILLDGVNIQKLKVSWLRQQMGLVSQEPLLFNDTVRANIAYGKQGEVTEEEIVAAANAANAHAFLSTLPQGYETSVGERGVQLSGGQKQRIAIARAILKNPKILLLDEATSALDAETERVVQDALDRAMVGRTTVIVAHRLTTIKGAGVITVLKDGLIVEKGRHDTLMSIRDGVYKSLVELRSSSA